ncbi:MAG: nucleotidyl transferase AbiEii/AbiGii toxin family protein [Actinomycetota bacterium]
MSGRDISASVRARLLSLAKDRGEQFELTLTRFALERLLYRLSCSEHKDRFVLKGATLFALWAGGRHRPTRDLDLLARGDVDIAGMTRLFQSFCNRPAEDDGVHFQSDSVLGERIREDETYEGIRVTLMAHIGGARLKLQVDCGFGDAVTPAARHEDLPTLLDFPQPRLLTYPRETVVAEKCEALVNLGLRTSRLKDFYDLWFLGRRFDFDGETLSEAFAATFERRRTALPLLVPPALTEAFYEDAGHLAQWSSFLRRSGLLGDAAALNEVVDEIRRFLMPPLLAASGQIKFSSQWSSNQLVWAEMADFEPTC